MKSVSNMLIGIIALTALIGIVLYANGYPPERAELVRWKVIGYQVITFPLFFAGMAALFGLPLLRLKRSVLDTEPSKARNATIVSILIAPALMFFMQILFPLEAYGLMSDPTGDVLVLLASALMFGLVGNYMSIVPYEAKIGLKSRWTLADPVTWSKTHRFLGKYILLIVIIVTPVAALIDRENALMILIVAYLSAYVAGLFYARMIGRDRIISRAD
ncbi:SdpI family protein [Algimonas porphyrae]|uniref:SdpI family protein n=1 Tax=Algimonas porphyrae TaxID=1128113 RepID=A0ABQ5V2X6_9PROT|nr:SdpI family protein [Algimonas porphyrae]GLQ20587.1 hypothetical protein GCM10007854_15420 [Algimonas porphyrae]